MSQLSTPNAAPRIVSAANRVSSPIVLPFPASSFAHAPSLTPKQRIRKAVLVGISSFTPPEALIRFPAAFLRSSSAEWKRHLHWLDVSGLALYFFDYVIRRGWHDALPHAVANRLQQNLEDNAKRTRGMIEESIAIQREFQCARISYAVMKGISLAPFSVPFPELRHQFDLDYLVAEGVAPLARRILERRGYRLRAISQATWEFKIHENPHVSLRDLYKDLPYRGVELHLESNAVHQTSRLDRVEHRDLYGISMPVLSPVDIFLGQAMHAYKDLHSGFCRASHLLEFHRHVRMRYNDETFWHKLRMHTEGQRRSRTAIGLVTLLLTSIFGDFAPPALAQWTVDLLPPAAHLWVTLYGHQVVLGEPPGNKLHLLLREALRSTGDPQLQPARKSLLPSRLPSRIIQSSAAEPLSTRLARYRVEARFLFTRLYFHTAEGLRYARELRRWRRLVDRLPS
jgi:Uncharacterised nucleotidyltransferase